MRFKFYFTVPADLTPDAIEAMRTKAVNNPARRDYLHKGMYTYWPALRVCEEQFRRDGILLPHGCSQQDFIVWNPTFLQNKGVWPLRDDVVVHNGWSYKQIMSGKPNAANDYLGAHFGMLKVFAGAKPVRA